MKVRITAPRDLQLMLRVPTSTPLGRAPVSEQHRSCPVPNSLYTRAARRGVTLSGYPQAINLGCDSSGSARSPNLQSGGRLPRRWWACPLGCNTAD
jgi:hypothetical protein